MKTKALNLEQVVDSFVAGDKESFKILYEETKDFIFNVIYRLIKHPKSCRKKY